MWKTLIFCLLATTILTQTRDWWKVRLSIINPTKFNIQSQDRIIAGNSDGDIEKYSLSRKERPIIHYNEFRGSIILIERIANNHGDFYVIGDDKGKTTIWNKYLTFRVKQIDFRTNIINFAVRQDIRYQNVLAVNTKNEVIEYSLDRFREIRRIRYESKFTQVIYSQQYLIVSTQNQKLLVFKDGILAQEIFIKSGKAQHLSKYGYSRDQTSSSIIGVYGQNALFQYSKANGISYGEPISQSPITVLIDCRRREDNGYNQRQWGRDDRIYQNLEGRRQYGQNQEWESDYRKQKNERRERNDNRFNDNDRRQNDDSRRDFDRNKDERSQRNDNRFSDNDRRQSDNWEQNRDEDSRRSQRKSDDNTWKRENDRRQNNDWSSDRNRDYRRQQRNDGRQFENDRKKINDDWSQINGNERSRNENKRQRQYNRYEDDWRYPKVEGKRDWDRNQQDHSRWNRDYTERDEDNRRDDNNRRSQREDNRRSQGDDDNRRSQREDNRRSQGDDNNRRSQRDNRQWQQNDRKRQNDEWNWQNDRDQRYRNRDDGDNRRQQRNNNQNERNDRSSQRNGWWQNENGERQNDENRRSWSDWGQESFVRGSHNRQWDNRNSGQDLKLVGINNTHFKLITGNTYLSTFVSLKQVVDIKYYKDSLFTLNIDGQILAEIEFDAIVGDYFICDCNWSGWIQDQEQKKQKGGESAK